jgi:hypothetical protein
VLLVVHDGILVCIIMSYPLQSHADSSRRYMERKGVPFTALWLKFGVYDPQYDTDYINEVANTASSIYFVNLVIM